jgi:hypothetical protein
VVVFHVHGEPPHRRPFTFTVKHWLPALANDLAEDV